MRNFDDFTQVAVDYTDDGFLKLKIKYYVAEEVKGSKWLASVTPDKYNGWYVLSKHLTKSRSMPGMGPGPNLSNPDVRFNPCGLSWETDFGTSQLYLLKQTLHTLIFLPAPLLDDVVLDVDASVAVEPDTIFFATVCLVLSKTSDRRRGRCCCLRLCTPSVLAQHCFALFYLDFFLKNIARIQLVTAKELLPLSKLTTTCCVACSGMLPIPRKESSFQTPSKRFPF